MDRDGTEMEVIEWARRIFLRQDKTLGRADGRGVVFDGAHLEWLVNDCCATAVELR